MTIGRKHWAIAEGYIPSDGDGGGDRRFVEVAPRRTLHLRFNDLEDPAPVPRETDYACTIEADVPIVVQHTRLDSRRAALALLSTIAFADD